MTLCLLLSLLPLSAQTPSPTEALPTQDAVQAQLDTLEKELEGLGGSNSPRRLRLEELRSLYQRQLIQLVELERAQTAPGEELNPAPADSYSIDVYDGLFDQLEAERQAQKTARLSLADAESSLKQAQEKVEDLEKQRRLLLDRIKGAGRSQTRLDLERQLDGITLELRVTNANAQLNRLQVRVAKSELEKSEKNLAVIRDSIDRVREKLVFDRDTLQERLTELAKRSAALQTRLQEAQDRLGTRETLLEKARLYLELEAPGDPVAAQAVRTRESFVRLSRRQIEVYEEQNRHLLTQKTVWERRFRLWNAEPDSTVLATWYEETGNELESTERSQQLRQAQLTEVRNTLTELSSRLTSPSMSQEMRDELDLEEQSLRSRESILNEALQELSNHQGLLTRFYEELDKERQTVDWGERWALIRGQLSAIWNTELYSVGESTVTLKKFFVAIILLVAGLWFAKRLVIQFRVKVLTKFKINTNAQVAIEKLLHYTLIIFVFLFALRVVNIPLTIFTFLGGSLAIAVGFGAQNILNNFISGLILMVERPVKVGDIIEVNGVLGQVEEIGARSTRVRRYTGIHVVVPNSALLENNMVNWTLEDYTFRTQVNVGVAYGSPVDEVFEKLEQAVNEQSTILKRPAPDIIFAEFGDNSLNFEVHFWVTADSPMAKKRIESQLRRTIDRLLNEAGIVIAFPQRDVHLDTLRPLEVRVIEAGNKKKGSK